ncbi:MULTISPECIES: NAD-dependent epimerase/dehydratase family protein [Microbacterium]|uniref:NAD-dependent epimerase/dehydratase family protein n=1 Tax=Microbacterium TaxID=33882 RepID=UPI00076888CF|nr:MULTISPECIES: NAD(P)-dependent oxidoreductase [Microbacterium]KXC06662.1 UDP-glucose 4-epimerase [Microbacterium hominis]QOC24378.1 NAD(P)-dependent oxidoreductase [Microbacterium hominis]QOC28459.1 NAD(P)-dependent oxidoreductase [Microbacterium hominis]QYF96341.1 NAD(P)-dependent oxidoreductase [Microbacterium sp. PAMC21962]
MRIAVTGASGKLGTVVVNELREAGHDVVGLDVVGTRGAGFVQVDLTDYGQTVDALQGVNDQHDGLDAVVHLAAIPAPGIRSDVATFHNNIAVTFNVLWAAIRLGITRIVTASSETVQGLPFDVPPPYIPVDEAYAARPESVYSLVKHLEETLEKELVRWHPEVSLTALRFSNVMVPADYAEFPSFDADAARRKWNLWSYIDARDGAAVIARALEVAPAGFDHFLIAAGDTVMSRPNAELVAEVFPDVEVRGELGVNASLFSTAKAQRLLGWTPRHSWRDER